MESIFTLFKANMLFIYMHYTTALYLLESTNHRKRKKDKDKLLGLKDVSVVVTDICKDPRYESYLHFNNLGKI